MVSSANLDAEIGGLVVAIFVVLVIVYMLYRYLRRRGPELAAREGKTVLDDRSYNQIRIGQAAADRLSQTGVDVSAAKELFRRAEVARASGNYDLSLELSKKGQDSLAAARSGAMVLPSSAPARSTSPADASQLRSPSTATRSAAAAVYAPPSDPPRLGGGANGPVLSVDSGAAVEPEPARPPKNKMEAHFQLSLVQDELDQARAAKSRSKPFRDAEALRDQGQAAYDKQDFTEALRLALKSRRALGTRVEALPVSPIPASAPGGSDPGAAAARASGSLADAPTFGQKCAKCGRTASPTDQFCRGCGAPITPALCNSCGAPLLAGDRFCGRCGATQT
jgi:Double zinc ribbon